MEYWPSALSSEKRLAADCVTCGAGGPGGAACTWRCCVACVLTWVCNDCSCCWSCWICCCNCCICVLICGAVCAEAWPDTTNVQTATLHKRPYLVVIFVPLVIAEGTLFIANDGEVAAR